eukprot:2022553-Rhodomonas_salina.1
MAGRSGLKKQLLFKPICEGIQFYAFAESRAGSQYLVDFPGKIQQGKIQKGLLRLVSRLPAGSK